MKSTRFAISEMTGIGVGRSLKDLVTDRGAETYDYNLPYESGPKMSNNLEAKKEAFDIDGIDDDYDTSLNKKKTRSRKRNHNRTTDTESPKEVKKVRFDSSQQEKEKVRKCLEFKKIGIFVTKLSNFDFCSRTEYLLSKVDITNLPLDFRCHEWLRSYDDILNLSDLTIFLFFSAVPIDFGHSHFR